jgi:hypothetical protein
MRGNLTPMSVLFRDYIVHRMEFDDLKITKGIGMIPMIVPAKSRHQYLT